METEVQGILNRCETQDECIVWKQTSITYKGKPQSARRLVFRMAVGEIPDGHWVRSSCRNSLCVNPAHLLALPRAGHNESVPCATCTREFTRAIRADASPYCSRRCKDQALRRYVPTPDRHEVCEWCESPFITRTKARLCPECSVDITVKRASAKMHAKRSLFATKADFSPLDIFKRDAWTCGICREQIDRHARSPEPNSPSIDHIVPLEWGGEHLRTNVRAAHLLCNTTKLDPGNLVALLAAT